MAVEDSVEVALAEIGFGRWQVLALAVSLLFHVFSPVQQLGSTLLSAPVAFRCSYPDGHLLANFTNIEEFGYVDGINKDVDKSTFPSKCLPEIILQDSTKSSQSGVTKINLNKKATGLPSCPFVEYDLSIFDLTVITEWDLICERSNLRPIYQMAYSIGALLGSLFCGQLSDWLGRKRTMQIGGLLTLASVLASGVSPWYELMIAMRILAGTGTILMLFPVYTLISEVSPASHRTISIMLPGGVYFAGMGILAGTAYLIPHWRKLTLICNSPLLIFVPLTFFLDESPRWLMQRGRTSEAVDILKKAASQNGVVLSSNISKMLADLDQMSKDLAKLKFSAERQNATQEQGTLQLFLTCFSLRGMRTVLIVLPFLWFVKRSLYLGIVLNANNFTSSSPFQYMALSGAMGVIAVLISIPLSLKFGRRPLLAGTLVSTGILMLLDMCIPFDYWLVKWSLVMLSFCIACAAFQVNYVYSSELFPTVIRTRGFTFTNFVGSIGEMSIPLVTDIAAQYAWWAPSVTFGLAALIGSILLPLLPETKDKPMPETLNDVERRYWQDYRGLDNDSVSSKDSPNLKKANFEV